MNSITRRHGLFGLALLAFVANLATPAVAQDATYVGEAKCVSCHTDDNAHFTYTLHAKTFRANPKNEREKRGCEACHGPGLAPRRETRGERHDHRLHPRMGNAGGRAERTVPRLPFRRPAPALARLDARAQCDRLQRLPRPMARFSRNGLLRAGSISETCQTCHQQQRAEFQRRSHMPVPEGKMSCADCHNPHGSVTRPLLKADSVNETCYACHAEKRGPFLWEHAPVRENCANCHLPHGSNHDKLLAAARPYLCQQCHNPPVGHPGQFFRADQTAAAALQGGAQSARVIGRSCQNCHVVDPWQQPSVRRPVPALARSRPRPGSESSNVAGGPP